MHADYWKERWTEGRTGFHIEEVNPGLVRFAPRLLGEGPKRVLVPLCGKSHDLDWLVAQGHQVTGIELASIPVAEVMARAGEAAVVEALPDGGRRHVAGALTLLEADVLTCPLPEVDAIWDRGALIALKPEQRVLYAQRLRAALAPGGRLLNSVVSYDQDRMPGPPHSVDEAELRQHYAGFEVEQLATQQLAGPGSKWSARGVDDMRGVVWLLTKGA